jgi:signal transduction histidine kinase
MDKPNFEANISYGLNVIFILLFVAPFTISISHAVLFNLISLLYIPVLAIVSGEDFLWSRWPTNLLFLNGIGIVCIIFSKLITHFLKTAIESKLKIEELSHYKQKITRLIIHDLKVPTSAILNLSNDQENRSMREINSQAYKINKQLEDVLDVERLEEPNVILDLQEITIDKLVEQAIHATEMLALKKNIILNTVFNVNGSLKCDSNLIERTLINLLTNAIKYSPANERITLTVQSEKENCNISIEDNGIGIPTEQLTKIFNNFYRVNTKKSTGNSSTGLGLAFCKLAVEAHKGSIIALSGKEYGIGSKFEITLPHFKTTNSKETSKKEYTHPITLSEQEKIQLVEICNQLVDIPIYKASEIMQLTKQLNAAKSKNIIQWHERFIEAVYSGKQESLNELIEPFLINKPVLSSNSKK